MNKSSAVGKQLHWDIPYVFSMVAGKRNKDELLIFNSSHVYMTSCSPFWNSFVFFSPNWIDAPMPQWKANCWVQWAIYPFLPWRGPVKVMTEAFEAMVVSFRVVKQSCLFFSCSVVWSCCAAIDFGDRRTRTLDKETVTLFTDQQQQHAFPVLSMLFKY